MSRFVELLGGLDSPIREQLASVLENPHALDVTIAALFSRFFDPASNWKVYSTNPQPENTWLQEHSIVVTSTDLAARIQKALGSGYSVYVHRPDETIENLRVALTELTLSAPRGIPDRSSLPTGEREAEPLVESEIEDAARDRRAQLRYEHAGQFVAWSPDFSDVVYASTDPLEVRKQGRASGSVGLIYEWLPPVQR